LNVYLPLWSLSMEVQFLLVLVLVLRFFNSSILFLLGLVSLAKFVIWPSGSHFDPFDRFWIFCSGCFFYSYSSTQSWNHIISLSSGFSRDWMILNIRWIREAGCRIVFYLATRGFCLYLCHSFVLLGFGSFLSPAWLIFMVFIVSEIFFSVIDKRFVHS